MRINMLFCVAALWLFVGALPACADVIILKSGEMFQTPKAWKENGVVNYYKDGRVVRIAESDVERLIVSRKPAEMPPPPEKKPPVAPVPEPQIPEKAPAPSMGHSVSAMDEAGHLGLRWGLAKEEIGRLELVSTDPAYGGVEQYVNPQGKRRFGRAGVDNIYYGFWQGGLYTILVEVSNYLDFMDLKVEAFRRYGARSPVDENGEKYRWSTLSTDRLLAFDNKTDTGYLWMRSVALHKQVEANYPE